MKWKLRSGFSLIELLIGVLLTALLLQAVFSLLSSSFVAWKAQTARVQVHQTARMSMSALVRELRPAYGIVSPLPGGSGNEIKVVHKDATGNLQTLTFRTGTYWGKNPRTLYRTVAAGQPTPLTENCVSELKFTVESSRLVKIRMTVTDERTQLADTLEMAVVCRNAPE